MYFKAVSQEDTDLKGDSDLQMHLKGKKNKEFEHSILLPIFNFKPFIVLFSFFSFLSSFLFSFLFFLLSFLFSFIFFSPFFFLPSFLSSFLFFPFLFLLFSFLISFSFLLFFLPFFFLLSFLSLLSFFPSFFSFLLSLLSFFLFSFFYSLLLPFLIFLFPPAFLSFFLSFLSFFLFFFPFLLSFPSFSPQEEEECDLTKKIFVLMKNQYHYCPQNNEALTFSFCFPICLLPSQIFKPTEKWILKTGKMRNLLLTFSYLLSKF